MLIEAGPLGLNHQLHAAGIDVELGYDEVIQVDIRGLTRRLRDGWISGGAAVIDAGASEELRYVLVFAIKCGYDFIRFEERDDLEPHPDLPVFV